MKNKCIKVIQAGDDQDNSVHDFWDYVYTLARMKTILEEKCFKQPFMIISDKETKLAAQNGNHSKPIGKEFIEKDGDILVFRDTIVVNEFDYIMSLDWINGWDIEEYEDNWHNLILVDKDGNFVSCNDSWGLTI